MAITDNLVAWWSCDEASGNLLDSTETYDATDNNTVGSDTGKVAGGRLFTRANNEFFSLADNPDISLGPGINYTWAFWVKFNSLPGAMDIFAKWTGDNEYLVRYEPTGDGIQIFVRNQANTSNGSFTHSANLDPDVWYFFVVQWDTVNDLFKISLNGEVPETSSYTGGTRDTATALSIGARGDGTNALDGILDEVAIWDRVITDEEIAWLYNSGSGRSYADTQGPPPETTLIAAVPASQRLPGFCGKYGGGANGAFWESASNAGIIDIGQHSFVKLFYVRDASQAGIKYIESDYANSSNFFAIRRNTSTDFEMRFATSGGANLTASCPRNLYATHAAILAYRNGDQWGIYSLAGGGGVIEETLQTDGEITFAVGAAGDTFSSSIAQNSSARHRIAHLNGGASDAAKWTGSIGLCLTAICGDGETLADYGLDTDLGKLLLMKDAQRIFSVCGFSESQVFSYGNWKDTSGNSKEALQYTQFASGDKLVCPFSAKELVLADGIATATELATPPYSMPGTADPLPLLWGSTDYLDYPTSLVNPNGGLLVARQQRDQSGNPHFYIDFVDENGPYRWPVHVPYPWHGTDASAGGAVAILSWNRPGGTVINAGDNHSNFAMNYLLGSDKTTITGIVAQPYMHSNSHADTPDTGDAAYQDSPFVILTDDTAAQIVWPQGAANAWLKTYSLLTYRDGYTIGLSRRGSNTNSPIIFSYLNHTDLSAGAIQVMGNQVGNELRGYPGWPVNMSDGRSVVFCRSLTATSGTIVIGAVITATNANLANNAEWFTPTGKKLDGTVDAALVLGNTDLRDDWAEFTITEINQADFENLPLPAYNTMDHIRLEQPAHVTGSWEGLAAIVRTSLNNGDLSRNLAGTPNGSIIPYDVTELRTWTYTPGSAPSLVPRDTFDITDIIEKHLTGIYPTTVAGTKAECTALQCQQIGDNQLLVFLLDQLVQFPADTITDFYEQYSGWSLRGLLFYDLGGTDPTKYQPVKTMITLPTDGSNGWGFSRQSAQAVNGYSQATAVKIWGGFQNSSSTGYGNYVPGAIDLTNKINDALSGGRRRSYQQLLIPSA